MKEMQVEAGERIDRACSRLEDEAPAFMVFNGIRVEAQPGDTQQTLYARFNDAWEARVAAHEATKDQAVMIGRRYFDMLAAICERTNVPMGRQVETLIVAAHTRLEGGLR